MINLIGLSGKMQHGKGAVATIIQKLTLDYDDAKFPGKSSWEIKKFADKLKDCVCLITGYTRFDLEDNNIKNSSLGINWDNMTVREVLQKLGTEGGRNVHENIWVNATFSNYNPDNKWIIDDCRFINEAKSIEDRGGIVIRVNRTNHINNPEFKNHKSEISLDDYPFKYYIENDGSLEDLELKVKNILIEVGVI
jgi:hypothetical protein